MPAQRSSTCDPPQASGDPGFSRSLERGLAILGSFTSNLAIRDDTDVILIDRVRGRPGRYHHLEPTLHAGSSLSFYCSATGKALLAFLSLPDLGSWSRSAPLPADLL